MKTVEFTQHYAPYVVGDIAGLEDGVADEVIKAKVAKPYEKAEKKEVSQPQENKMVAKAEVKK